MNMNRYSVHYSYLWLVVIGQIICSLFSLLIDCDWSDTLFTIVTYDWLWLVRYSVHVTCDWLWLVRYSVHYSQLWLFVIGQIFCSLFLLVIGWDWSDILFTILTCDWLWLVRYSVHEEEIGRLAKDVGFTHVSLSSETMSMSRIVQRGFTGLPFKCFYVIQWIYMYIFTHWI